MGEIEAAIGLEQYKKLKKIIFRRSKLIWFLIEQLQKLPQIDLPKKNLECTHNFYILPIKLNIKNAKTIRKKVVRRLNANGLDFIREGYANLHLLPMFQNQIAYGTKGFPWTTRKKKFTYKRGICPVAEKLESESFITFVISLYELNLDDIKNIVKIFIKVWKEVKLKKI